MQEKVQTVRTWLDTGSLNIFGMPFAGKDTLARELATLLDGAVLGGGEILRSSTIPEHVRKIIDAGGLAPTDDYIRIVLPYLSREEFANKPLILSSVGRWHGEEAGVLGAAKSSGHELKAVLYLNIDQAVALERWEHSQVHATRGARLDDERHKLDTRFAEFKNKTLPVIDYYRELGLVIDIDGTASSQQVLSDIVDALDKLSQVKAL